ncbi:MAG TPA: CHAT domain-containing protein, partial [Ignavibacteriaceae bacterium]
ALDIRIKLLGNKNPKAAESYRLSGDIYLAKNKFDSALYNYQNAIIVLTDNFTDENPRINPELSRISPQRNILSALSRKANAYYLRYRTNMSEEDLTSSAESYDLCDEIILKLRRSYKTESAKLAIEESAFNIYEYGITVNKTLFDASGDRIYLEKCFSLAEKSKAGILLDSFFDSDAKVFSGVPDSLLEKERLIRVDLSYFDTQIQKEKEKRTGMDSTRLKTLEEDFFSTNRKYDSLLDFYRKEHPDYFNIKYPQNFSGISDVQNNLLGSDEALIEYFAGDSALFIITITKSNSSIYVAEVNYLTKVVNAFRQSLLNLDFDMYVESASELYLVLIRPVEHELAQIKKLYIIPDRILNYVPFEALLVAADTSGPPDFSKLNYLINKFEISYYYSAATLLESKKIISETNPGFAGFAPVFSDDDATQNKIASVMDTSAVFFTKRAANVEGKIYSALPETEKEITEISALFIEKNINSKIFTRKNAGENVIKSDEMKNFNVLHIASHGFMNEKKPKLSGVLFWINEEEEAEDGILYANEIYTLNLNADLVVLSACESGLGKIVRGEGIIGLTRALTFAGAKNIVVSLWQVADESTSELMIEFYKNILSGKNYSSSLREAKLKLIEDGTYSYPLEWSPFVLIGR